MTTSCRLAFALIMLCAAAASAAPTPPPTEWQRKQQEMSARSAPADEYFGRQKLSYLGINNMLRDAAISSGSHTVDRKIVGNVATADEAIADWIRKYPRDPQLARTYFLAMQANRKIWLKANQERAWVYLNRIVQLFPDTYFGKQVHKDLANGFTEHYDATPVPCDPNAPSPAPAPTPVVHVLAKNHRVQLEPVACIPPPSPSPSPSPEASASPSASPEASPSAAPSASPTGS
jgi:hypothetical protein